MGDSVDCFYVLGRDHPDTIIEPSITLPSLSFRRHFYHVPVSVESAERTIPLSGETASWHKRCCKASSCLDAGKTSCWEGLIMVMGSRSGAASSSSSSSSRGDGK